MQPVRIFIGVDNDTGTFIPLNVDANGNMGVNMEGELAVGELQLAATDPGLLALATALAGVSPKTLADIYTLASSGAGLKVTGAVTTSGTATVSGTVAVSTLPDAANAVLTAVKDQLTDYLATREAPSTSIVSGQNASIPANASTAVVLTTSQACAEVTIQAPAANNVSILFGSGTGTCYMELAPGRDFTLPVSNVNLIYVKSSTSDTSPKVNWIARA
jgi:hypothetical protein